MELKWATILLFAALLSCSYSLDWQGAGNWTYDNLTTIRSKIFAFPPETQIPAFSSQAEALSNQLNTLWDPAWNVFIITYSDGNNYDAILYGYGFRDHWFWFNGFKIKTGYASFIIWKDYNCITWTTFSSIGSPQNNMDASLSSAILAKLQQGRAKAARNVEDIWVFAQDVQATIPTSSPSLFQEKTAYTIVAVPTSSVYFFGKFCAKQYILTFNVGNRPGGYIYGTTMIMQMRDQ